jgi:tRNA threonylcarbamoyladenosine biosynthesis protein TsaE
VDCGSTAEARRVWKAGKYLVKEFSREKKFKTRSVNGTLAIAHTIAEILAAPRVVILRGELGAGKTTLVKGWLEFLGAAMPEEVTSPTFTLVHEYQAKKGKVYHLDLYRLEQEHELAALGIDEMAEEPGAIVLIEWGEKFPSLMARADAEVALAHLEEPNERSLLVHWRE